MTYHLTIEKAKEALARETGQRFTILMQHGTMRVEYFAPYPVDTQQPHTQDELYVIASGTSTFYRNGERVTCRQGDVLFVPAGMKHRFENFSEDFATWVIFYGNEADVG